MKNFVRLMAFTLGIVMCHFAFASDIYKWVDAEGNVHFGDNPPENVQPQQVTVTPNVYTTPTVETLAPKLQEVEPVVLYSASWCGHCKNARAYFQSKGIAFAEYDVETSEKGKQDYARLGARGVPVILVGKQRLNGFNPDTFDRLYAATVK